MLESTETPTSSPWTPGNRGRREPKPRGSIKDTTGIAFVLRAIEETVVVAAIGLGHVSATEEYRAFVPVRGSTHLSHETEVTANDSVMGVWPTNNGGVLWRFQPSNLLAVLRCYTGSTLSLRFGWSNDACKIVDPVGHSASQGTALVMPVSIQGERSVGKLTECMDRAIADRPAPPEPAHEPKPKPERKEARVRRPREVDESAPQPEATPEPEPAAHQVRLVAELEADGVPYTEVTGTDTNKMLKQELGTRFFWCQFSTTGDYGKATPTSRIRWQALENVGPTVGEVMEVVERYTRFADGSEELVAHLCPDGIWRVFMFHSFYLEPQGEVPVPDDVREAIQAHEAAEADALALQCWVSGEGKKLVPEGLEGALEAAVELLVRNTQAALAEARTPKRLRVA